MSTHSCRRWSLWSAVFLLVTTFAALAAAQESDEGEFGSLWFGPEVGVGLAFAGPRAAYGVGLELSYHTPHYFYYELGLRFLHHLPSTVDVDASSDGEGGNLAPAHEVDVKGLFGVPLSAAVGLRFDVGRAALRFGVGLGAMASVQRSESQGTESSELIVSFCFRPELGLDFAVGDGLLLLELSYLWQDATFETTGGSHDVDSLFLTVGYAWGL